MIYNFIINHRDKSKRRTAPTIVSIGVVATTMQILLGIATTTIRAILTAISAHAFHSNTNLRLCILRNTYSEGISIKEIYSFLELGKNVSVKCVLVEFLNICILRDPAF